MTTGPPDIRIIGIGNTFRSDDGAGIAVVQRVREQIATGITVTEESGEGTALLEAWKGARAVIVVDAVHSGAPPGTIHRLDACAKEIPRQFFHYSTHAFGVREAVQLGRAMNQLPPRLIVNGIEGKNFGAGVGLSTEVEQASIAVAARVLDEVRTLNEGDPSCTNSHS